MKLENHIKNIVAATDGTWRVIAHELTHDGEGWSVNDSWQIVKSDDETEILEAIRGRWEIFKINYLPKARVKDITCEGDEVEIYLDCAGIPFLTLRKD
jgi:hypothetical protein